jgi:hypothetical protein
MFYHDRKRHSFWLNTLVKEESIAWDHTHFIMVCLVMSYYNIIVHVATVAITSPGFHSFYVLRIL